MYEVLKAGGFTNGGLNFDAKARRASSSLEDIFYGYIAGMDTFALGLKLADRIIRDGRLDQFLADRYASWNEGLGARIRAGQVSLTELEQIALAKGEVETGSGRQEYLETLINNLIIG